MDTTRFSTKPASEACVCRPAAGVQHSRAPTCILQLCGAWLLGVEKDNIPQQVECKLTQVYLKAGMKADWHRDQQQQPSSSKLGTGSPAGFPCCCQWRLC